MRVIDLFNDGDVVAVNTQGQSFCAFGSNLDADAGCERTNRPGHTRGCVRLVIDPGMNGGGIATRIVRPGAYRPGWNGKLEPRDVLEIHSLGDMETIALAEALIFAGKQLLKSYPERDRRMAVKGAQPLEPNALTSGTMRIIGQGCVWGAK